MPVAIGIFDLPSDKHFAYKSIVDSIFEIASSDIRRKDNPANDLENIANFNNQNIFDLFPELKGLETYLIDFALSYIKLTGFICEEVIITDAWLNKANANAQQNPHVHYNSFLSGTYYVNFDMKNHGGICCGYLFARTAPFRVKVD